MRNKGIVLVGAFLLAFALIFGCAGGGPTGLKATPVAGGVELSWQAPSGASVAGYNVYRGTASGTLGNKVNAALVTGFSYKDTAVQDGNTYFYTVRSVDASGNEDGNMAQASATAKTSPPFDLEISINSGQQYATTQQVTLYLSAQGANECRFSNDGNTWGAWEAYATQKSWELSPDDGNKDVYYQCQDSVGNAAIPVSAAIYLDTVPPRINLASPVQGGTYAGGFDIILTVTDAVSETATCSGNLDNGPAKVGVVQIGVEQAMSVTTYSGTHNLEIDCSDGVQSMHTSVEFTVVDKPDVSLHIQSGAGYVDTRGIKLDLSAHHATECRFSNDGNSWGGWATYATSASWQLSAGDGTKTVYAECRSGDGSLSDVESDSVVLDTSPPPYVSIMINDEAKWTNRQNVQLGLYCFSGDMARYSNEVGAWSSWQPYDSGAQWQLSNGYGSKTVYYECKDRTGALVGSASADIVYARSEPQPPSNLEITINGGDAYASERRVSLDLSADDANECRLKENGKGWGEWGEYTESMHFTLSSGDGKKVIYYECRNDFGEDDTYSTIYLDTAPPGPVSDLGATASGDGIHLSWSSPGGVVSSYNVYRSTEGFGLITQIGTTTSRTYVDRDPICGLGYNYWVRVVDRSGVEGANSNMASENGWCPE